MADPDLIARLYAYGKDREGWAKDVIKKLNPSLYVGGPTRLPSPDVPYDPDNRQPTRSPEACGPDPYLELRFSHCTRSTKGFVLGKDSYTSDIVLVNRTGISDHHCAITFENDFKDTNHYRLVVRDLGSKCGTAVSYDTQANMHKGGVRRDFRWIIGGHSFPDGQKIVIEFHEHLKFQIVVSNHDIASQLYIDNVGKFFEETKKMDDLFSQMGVPSRPPTEPATGAQTPGTGEIYLQKHLGEGAFGVVTHFWDVSDADEYALKEPSRAAIREKRVDVNAWKKEAKIMGKIQHVSWKTYFAVPFLPLISSPAPYCYAPWSEVSAVASINV